MGELLLGSLILEDVRYTKYIFQANFRSKNDFLFAGNIVEDN